MRTDYLFGPETIESYFPTARPWRINPGLEQTMWMEAEKEDKFYLIFDLRSITKSILPRQSQESQDLSSRPFTGFSSIVVQEFDSEEERAQEIARHNRGIARMLASQARGSELTAVMNICRSQSKKKGKKGKGEGEGGASVPARIRPKPPTRSGGDAKPRPEAEG